jgi:DNA-binding CsgD family transcriptional regulator
VYPSVVLGGVLRRFADEARDTSHGVGLLPLLTERERDVLACLSEGWSGPEIAEHLDMAVGTVRTHISRIFRKLGVHSRLEAVRIARESELEVRSSTRRRSRSSVVPASTPLRGLPGPRGQAGSTARPSDRPTEYRG